MKSLDEVVAAATADEARLQIDTTALSKVSGYVADGLFFTPLLALTILVIAQSTQKGLPTADIATWSLATLVRRFEPLRLGRGRLLWSVLLRRRCADALVFLENVGLVTVQEVPLRTVTISDAGRPFVNVLLKRPDEVGVLVRQLKRAYRAVEYSGLELL